MAEITVEAVNAKLAKGEVLTKEETEFVMSIPPEDISGRTPMGEEEEIDWEKAEDLDNPPKKKKEPEKKPEEDKAKEAEKKKQDLSERAKKQGLAQDAKEEDIIAAEKKTEEASTTIDMEKLERELSKEKGKEDLKDFTKREQAYFWQMRRERETRQKAEEERDAALFREAKRKKEEEAKPKEEEEDPLKELKEKDPEEYMTVADVVKTVEGVIKKLTKPPEKKEEKEPETLKIDPVRFKYLKMCDEEARAAHPDDYDAVMELTEEIVNTNKDHLAVVAEAIAKGENPAETSYQLIKSDPEFLKLYPAAETKVKARKKAKKTTEKTPEEIEKEKKAKEAEEALEKERTKTTGHAGGEGGLEEGETIDGYTITDITKMSDLQFAKLPKKTREKFLQKYG